VGDILIDLTLINRFFKHVVNGNSQRALEPIVAWHNQPDRGYTSVKIYTWDRAGLFAKIAGALASAELNILNALIFSRSDGIILDTFYVVDARTGKLVSRRERDAFKDLLTRVLAAGGRVDFEKEIARLASRQAVAMEWEGMGIPTRIRIDNESVRYRTIVEVETEDRIGLLYLISKVLTDLGLNISVARICTEKGAAIDTFYVRDTTGKKILDEEKLAVIKANLHQTLDSYQEK